MRDLLVLWASTFLGEAASLLLLWTTLALAAEAVLRLSRAHAALALPVRSALLAALPTALLAGPLVRWLTPAAVVRAAPLARVRDAVLPEIVVGATGGAPSGPPDALVWLGAALALAALVGLVALVRLAVACVRLVRLDLPDAPEAVQARAAAALVGVRRSVRVVTGGDVPMTFGLWRPVLAVPPGLRGDALALAHEAAHLRAGDFGWHLAASVVAAAFAAHPLVRVLARGQALDRERLADAAVLAARPDARRAYADLLMSMSDVRTPRLALGVARPPLLHRLTAMTTLASPSRVRAARLSGRLLAGLVLAATALAAFTSTRPDRAFRLVNPTITLDGTVLDSWGSEVSATPFHFFELTVVEYGRVLVSDAPFDGAERAGVFGGRRLDVTVGGHTLSVLAEARLFTEERPITAYARFDAYDGPPAPLGSAIVGVGVKATLDDVEPVASRVEFERAMPAGLPRGRAVVRESRVAGWQLPPADAFRTTAAGDTVFEFVGQMPEIEGGLDALLARIVFPPDARADGASGTAVVRLVVAADGTAGQITVARSTGDARLDSAAVQAVRTQPFVAGRQDGRAVAVRLTLPVRFTGLPEPGSSPPWGADFDYSASIDRYVDHPASMSENNRSSLLSFLATNRQAFEGMESGSAQVRLRIGDANRAVDIEVVSQTSETVGRFARFAALTLLFKPEGAGRTGTLDVTVRTER